MKTLVSAQELADLRLPDFPGTRQSIQRLAQAEGWKFTRERIRGGYRYLYIVEMLPDRIREGLAMATAREKEKLLPAQGRKGTDLTSVPRDPGAGKEVALLAPEKMIVPEQAKESGLARYRLVHAFREALAAARWGRKDEAAQAFVLAYNSGGLLPAVHEQVGTMALQTIRALDKTLREHNDNYLAIADGRGGWRTHGTTKWRKRYVSLDMQRELLRCWLHPSRPTVRMAILAARTILVKEQIVEACSDDTLYRWLGEYEERNGHVVCLAREGMKAYIDRFGAYITRQNPERVGQVLVADGHKLNFTILHPVTGKPCRMSLIVFFDWFSRCPAGWQIMPTENSVAIMAALRNAILTMGLYPEVVYLDNGAAFKARIFTETNPDLSELTGLYARLGIGVTFATPFNARAKLVERFFETLGDQCERLMPSFCGGSIDEKPAWLLANEKLHKAWHKAKTGNWVPNIREAAHIINAYFNWYVQQPHAGIGGQRPIDLLTAGRGPGVDAAGLYQDFLWRERRTPSRCRVTLFGIEYESDALHGLKQEVMLYYDTANLDRIQLTTLDGVALGEAYPVAALPALARMFGDQVGVDQVKAALARQRRLVKQTRMGLAELGVAAEDTESIDTMPWAQKITVLPGGRTEGRAALPAPAEISSEERRRLELVVDRAIAEAEDAEPEIERPEYFRSEVERYEWCFKARHEKGAALNEEDRAFMAYFEQTADYQNLYRTRFDDLLELYQLYRKGGAGEKQ